MPNPKENRTKTIYQQERVALTWFWVQIVSKLNFEIKFLIYTQKHTFWGSEIVQADKPTS